MIIYLGASLIFYLHVVRALYSPTSDVIELTDINFNSAVIDSNSVWIVEFFAPWCGHCKNFAPEYSKAATALKDVAKVGAIDCDKYRGSAACSSVTGFPTIKVYGANKQNPTPFRGARTAKGITEAAIDGIKDKVASALGGDKDSQKKSDSSNDVIELTDSNFDSLVLKSDDDIWLVEFYAPWCGHCKNLAPHWAEAATKLKGKVKFGALDATVHSSKAAEYSVQGYPTIKFFPSGQKSRSNVEDYNGGRSAAEIVVWALEKFEENLPAPEVKQATSNELFKEACEQHGLCVISVLPHILDCQSECRNRYLSILQKLANSFKRKQWGWIWTEAGAQPELESTLEIGGFGYPAMALLNQKKMKYSLLKGSYSEDGISEFLRDLSFGRGTTAAIKGASLPTLAKTEPWDGKDGELPQEEDLDLSDIDLDDEESSKQDEL